MMAAYMAFGWFLVTTRAHENHAFFALPLVVMATPSSRFSWAMYGLISMTLFLNVALHDFGLEPLRRSLFTSEALMRIQLANAGLGIAIFLVWGLRLWRGAPSFARAKGPTVPDPAPL